MVHENYIFMHVKEFTFKQNFKEKMKKKEKTLPTNFTEQSAAITTAFINSILNR